MDRVTVCGMTAIDCSVCLNGDVIIRRTEDVLVVGPIGSRKQYTAFIVSLDNDTRRRRIYVCCGCFFGSLKAFKKCVKRNHRWTCHLKDYLAAIAFAKRKLLR